MACARGREASPSVKTRWSKVSDNGMIRLDLIAEKVGVNTRAVLEASQDREITPRQAAEGMARCRVRRAMGYRRWS